MKTITIEIPDDIFKEYYNEEEAKRAIFEDLIIEERQKGNISLGRAAELLGITYTEFFDLLGKRGFTFVNISKDEQNESYEQFKKFMKDYKK